MENKNKKERFKKLICILQITESSFGSVFTMIESAFGGSVFELVMCELEKFIQGQKFYGNTFMILFSKILQTN